MLQIRHYNPPVTKAGSSVILAGAWTTKRARQKKLWVELQFVLSAVGRASRHSHSAESGFGTNVCHLQHDQNWNTTWVLKCFQSWHSVGGASTEHAHTWKEYNCISLWLQDHICQCSLSRKIHWDPVMCLWDLPPKFQEIQWLWVLSASQQLLKD